MTEDLTTANMKPQDTTNFLLGGMQKQLEAIALEQTTARGAGELFRAEIRESITAINIKLGATTSDVEVLKARQVPRTPWPSVVGGLASLGALVGFIVLYFAP